MIDIRVTDAPFDPYAALAGFAMGRSDLGALASFIGLCRDMTRGAAVDALTLEHYPGFTEREIARIADAVAARHAISAMLVIHRVGRLSPGEPIVLAAAAAAHRAAAFAAVAALMDYLKTDAPFWKRESGPDGDRWIDPTAEDRARRAAHDEEA